MPRLVVVLDTNVYRASPDAVFNLWRRWERSHGVIGYANYGTVVELLAHLADPETVDGRAAFAGAARLVAHCTEYDGAMHVVRFMASPLGQVTRYLFGHKPLEEEDADGYGALLGRLVHDPSFRADATPILSSIHADASTKRSAYVEMLWEKVVRTVRPDARDWADVTANSDLRTALLKGIRAGEGSVIIARGMVRDAAAAAGLRVSATEEERLAKSVLINFRIMIEYRNLIIEKLVSDGPNMTKRSRANGVFDQIVCGATGGFARIRGCPVVVVTDDGDILEAARRSDMSLEVVAPASYSALLELDRDSFQARVEAILEKQAGRRSALGEV